MSQKAQSPFEYPLVIKQHMDFIVFSIPDLGISIVESAPKDGKIDVRFMNRMSQTLAKTWLKAAERLQNLKNSKLKTPTASKTRESLSQREEKGFTTPEVAGILGVSENTVRRMVRRGDLVCETTSGGHRRFLESEIRRYLEETIDKPKLSKPPQRPF